MRALLFLPLVLVACLTLTSCAAAKGTGWFYVSLGTDVTDADISASGLKATKINQSKSFKDAGGVIKDGIKTTTMGGLVEKGMDSTTKLGTQALDAIK